MSHDTVGLKDYEPTLPSLSEELPDEEEPMRIVCLVKNSQPLVSTIKKDSTLELGQFFI